MIARENSKELPPFWELRNDLYYNTITNFSVKERPENVHGGILADDMGLGKTLTAIAVILTNFDDGRPLLSKRGKEGHPGKEYKDETIKLRGSNTNKKTDGHSEPSACSEEPSVSDVSEKSNVSDLFSFFSKRRKISVQSTESSESEEIETSKLSQKMKGKLKNTQLDTKSKVKGSSKIKEDTQFALALTYFAPATKRKMLKKGE